MRCLLLGRGLTGSRRSGRRSGFCGAPWSRTSNLCVGVPVLDAPVPQMVVHVVDVLRVFDRGPPEQVIEVPRVALRDVVPQRAVLRVPQSAEQLVDVPTEPGYVLAVVAVASLWVEGCTGLF